MQNFDKPFWILTNGREDVSSILGCFAELHMERSRQKVSMHSNCSDSEAVGGEKTFLRNQEILRMDEKEGMRFCHC